MDGNRRPSGALGAESSPDTPQKKPDVPTSKGKRIAALIGAVFMVILTIAYAYSIATGGIFKW